MMGIGEIKHINRVMTGKARRHKQQPWVPTDAQRIILATGKLDAGQRIPFLADYVPAGWEQTEDQFLFCDMSGFGASSEPAYTMQALARVIASDPIGLGYALVEQGQFQGYLARYARKVKAPRKPRNKLRSEESLEDRQDDLGLSPDF